ncbi:hypothetical protein VFPFJ_04809 [Purpureocillium lilacinum]|uniref:Uncharacterized protein n=1 Tax=Purpureocillium lilacinum TaxID=33203 RepID=A0A179HMG5_PURLI|nr:hypothetical protein VFPFJ_04809 [Purpureocillium lilacinum]OAQ90650.1 hypothetical protein VFPFJ_04809 [Purpureocillium lilacinum]
MTDVGCHVRASSEAAKVGRASDGENGTLEGAFVAKRNVNQYILAACPSSSSCASNIQCHHEPGRSHWPPDPEEKGRAGNRALRIAVLWAWVPPNGSGSSDGEGCPGTRKRLERYGNGMGNLGAVPEGRTALTPPEGCKWIKLKWCGRACQTRRGLGTPWRGHDRDKDNKGRREPGGEKSLPPSAEAGVSYGGLGEIHVEHVCRVKTCKSPRSV